MDAPTTNSLTLYRDDLLHLRRETEIATNLTVYHLEAIGLDNPIMVSYRQTFEKKSDALRALVEMVERAEAMADEQNIQTAIDMLQSLEDDIKRAGGSKN